MRKGYTPVFGAVVVFAIVVLAQDQAQAGASASAPSKYRPNQVAVAHQERQAPRISGMTEFSSLARKPLAPRSRQ